MDPITAISAGTALANTAQNKSDSFFSKWIKPWYDEFFQKRAEQRAEQSQIRAEEREQDYILQSEQRANAEYDRRQKEQRDYDHPLAVANRYRLAGAHPLSAFGSGVVGQSQSVPTLDTSAPDTSGVPSKGVTSGPPISANISSIGSSIREAKALENQTRVSEASAKEAEAKAKEAEARADAIDKETKYEEEVRPIKKRMLEADEKIQEQHLLSATEKATMDKINTEILEATKQDKIDLSNLDVREAHKRINVLEKVIRKYDDEHLIAPELLKKYRMEAFALEVKATLGVREFEHLTGRDYYTQEHIGYGKWQLEYDKLSADASLAETDARLAAATYDVNVLAEYIDVAVDLAQTASCVNGILVDWEKIGITKDQLEHIQKMDRAKLAFEFGKWLVGEKKDSERYFAERWQKNKQQSSDNAHKNMDSTFKVLSVLFNLYRMMPVA